MTPLARLRARLEHRWAVAELVMHRANSLWADGQKVTRRARRRLRKQARRDLTL
jgi:hypothetical protein